MRWFDMSFENVHGQDNVVPDALSHYPNLANMMVVTSSLLYRIQAAQSAALGDSCKILVANAQTADGEFTMPDCLVCQHMGELATIVIPEDMSMY